MRRRRGRGGEEEEECQAESNAKMEGSRERLREIGAKVRG